MYFDPYEKSDQQWAKELGLSIEEFRDEVPYTPDPDLSYLPCGQDDAVGDRIDSNKQVIHLRKKWEDSGKLLPFRGYMKMNWNNDWYPEYIPKHKE